MHVFPGWARAPEGGGSDGPKRRADRGRDSFSQGRECVRRLSAKFATEPKLFTSVAGGPATARFVYAKGRSAAATRFRTAEDDKRQERPM